jgi:putative protease
MLAKRSANAGNCAHTCRWDFRALTDMAHNGEIALEEKERPGEFFPIFEGEDFTAILSSKDLCMIDRLDDIKKAGVDCVKIEGRMKSVYYTAITALAYRKALDALEGKITREQAAPFVAELDNVPHREFTTAFYYDAKEADETTSGLSASKYAMAGIAGRKLSQNEADALFEKNPALGGNSGRYFCEFESTNKTDAGTPLEAVSPNVAESDAGGVFLPLGDYALIDPKTASPMDWVSHGHECLLLTAFALDEGSIIRAPCREL